MALFAFGISRAETYTYETASYSTETPIDPLLAQFNAQGARGYFVKGAIGSDSFGLNLIWERKSTPDAYQWTYREAPANLTSAAFIAELSAQGAAGYHLGFIHIQVFSNGRRFHLYFKTGDANYAIEALPATSLVTPSAVMAELKAEGDRGFRYLGQFGPPPDPTTRRIYARNVGSNILYDYTAVAAISSTQSLAVQTDLNLAGRLGWRLISLIGQFNFNANFNGLVFERNRGPTNIVSYEVLAGSYAESVTQVLRQLNEQGARGLAYLFQSSTPTGYNTIYMAEGQVPPVVPPMVSSPPLSQSTAIGGKISFSVGASGSGNSYQWLKDGINLPGATGTSYSISSVRVTDAGSYTVRVTNVGGSVTSAAAVLKLVDASQVSKLSNVSVRTTLSANQILTVGFTMQGGTKPVLIRAVGPSLGALGVSGTMADPKLTLFNGSVQVDANDNWGGTSTVTSANSAVGAFPFASSTSLDAALVASIGGGRTVQVSGATGGNVIVEAYDAGLGNSPKFTNISALNRVGTGSDLLIAGFTIAGSTPTSILMRAVGPTLAAAPFGISDTLKDPKLELFDSNQSKIGENDNYSSTLVSTFAALGAFALTAGSKDAAMLVTLQPGGYTVQVSGADGGVGTAIVELYEIPQ